jgi:hypothetical protein
MLGCLPLRKMSYVQKKAERKNKKGKKSLAKNFLLVY